MKMQMLFEAWLIEHAIGYASNSGYIKFALSNEMVKLDLSDKTPLLKVIEEIKRIVRNEYIPEPTSYEARIVDNCFKELYER